MRKTAGYVVIQDGLALFLDNPRGILLNGGNTGATLFPDRQSINTAIRRTRRYASDHQLSWDVEDYSIQRVVTP